MLHGSPGSITRTGRQKKQPRKKQQEKPSRNSPLPWLSQPENREFIRGCSHAWSSLPLSVVGWRFTLAECQANGTSGNLRASYTNIAGTTVSDFSLRITEIFGTTPFMVMPEGNSGGFSLPVNFQLSQTPLSVDTLPTVPALQEQLTTFSQSMRIKIDWREVNNSITDDEGNTIQPPGKSMTWRCKQIFHLLRYLKTSVIALFTFQVSRCSFLTEVASATS